MTGTPTPPVLEIADLHIRFSGAQANAVDRVSLSIAPDEVFGLVGESGSGKSLTASAALRLEPPTAQVTAARLEVCGLDLRAPRAADLRAVRGGLASMIFQEPMTALAPTRTIGAQMADAALAHGARSWRGALQDAGGDLANVNIKDPERVLRSFPHQLSGGMRQRVLIAMAFAGAPRLVIADEITTAIDPTTRVAVLDLLTTRAAQTRAAILFISHDLGAVARFCDRVGVMQSGRLVEVGAARAVIGAPEHPYTQRLKASLPGAGTPRRPLLGEDTP